MLEHGNYLESSHTINSLIQKYFHFTLPEYSPFIIIVTLSVLFMIFLGIKRKQMLKGADPEKANEQLFIISYFISVALIPNLVITDTEHFLLSLPLIMTLLYYVAFAKNYLALGAFIVLIFFFGGNSTDLLGKSLSGKFDELGLLGISNLIIISIAVYLFSFSNKSMKQFSLPGNKI
ncbi:MAG: hypothetical protein JJE25_13135 [Bacteroidia bacterium]|nr:hypothetical protein [Bacteroidia bacterium]